MEFCVDRMDLFARQDVHYETLDVCGHTTVTLLLQVQVLAEIGANNLEKRGLCSKYDPLTLLEALKCGPADENADPFYD